MIRPGLTFGLWCAIAAFIAANNTIGDTWIASALPVRAVEWYKVLVPLPYVALMAIIHGRRSAGPRRWDAALLAALLWPTSTMLLDFLYERLTFGNDVDAYFARFAVQWGAPYPLLIAVLCIAPLVAGASIGRQSPR